ncbi:hypothetical protein YIM1640_22470 [Thermus oshimai]
MDPGGIAAVEGQEGFLVPSSHPLEKVHLVRILCHPHLLSCSIPWGSKLDLLGLRGTRFLPLAPRTLPLKAGTTWTLRSIHWSNVTHGAGLFAAVGDGGAILTFPDGVTWTARTSGTLNELRSVGYGNGFLWR